MKDDIVRYVVRYRGEEISAVICSREHALAESRIYAPPGYSLAWPQPDERGFQYLAIDGSDYEFVITKEGL